MIPNTIHFIYGLKEDFGGKDFSFVHYLSILSAWKVNRPQALIYHYEYEPSGFWWERAKPYLQLDRLTAPTSVFGHPIRHFAHQADVLRLQILREQGGIYLDNDILCINPFKPLLEYDCVMGTEPGVGLCNAVILARAGAPFLDGWFEKYRDFNDISWNRFSVILPYRLAKENPELIHVEGPNSFFYPMYNSYRQIQYFWKNPKARRIGTALGFQDGYKERQLEILHRSYAIHLWEQFWWEPYLKNLTPQDILQNDNNFSHIVKQVIYEESLIGLEKSRPRGRLSLKRELNKETG